MLDLEVKMLERCRKMRLMFEMNGWSGNFVNIYILGLAWRSRFSIHSHLMMELGWIGWID